tara:strand:+ start:3352 stop:4878 length:1527 start_codon:yes stop_codon:yes gene_type:complete
MYNLNNFKTLLLVTSILFTQLISPLFAQKNFFYKLNTYDMRLTYESITAPENNPMGLIGVHYELNNFLNSNTYLGIGGYGALVGDYGGFFTAGITPGIRITQFDPIIFDLGIFIGGGGGASAFPGDGEMIRAHSYIGYKLTHSKLWLGIAKQQISKTSVNPSVIFGYSSQLSFLMNYQKSNTATPLISLNNISKYAFSITPSWTTYFPTSRDQGRNSTSINTSISLLTLDISKQIKNNFSGNFSLSGANSESADGYGAIFIGTSYNLPISKFQFTPQIKLGMAGGGTIDTGGGLLIHPQIFTSYYINSQYALASTIGYIKAPSGTFETWQTSIGLQFNAFLKKTNHANTPIIVSKKSPYNFKWFIENKTTIPARNIVLKTNIPYEKQIQFFGCGLKLPITKNIDSIFSTYWAYDGEVGAYAEGNFGVNLHTLVHPKLNLEIELLFGAAGGGGINVNKGTIHQETINISYKLFKTTSLVTKLGYQGAFSSDSFHGTVLGIGFKQTLNIM